jgi:hypothetical protein
MKISPNARSRICRIEDSRQYPIYEEQSTHNNNNNNNNNNNY